MAREFLRLTSETTPGTYNSAGTVYFLDIDGSNGYTVQPQPIIVTQRTAASANRRAAQIAKKISLAGNIAWTVRGSHAPLLADWFVGTSGGTVQKTYTVDHGVVLEDGATTYRTRGLGMFVQQGSINASEQDQWLKASASLVGLGWDDTIDDTAFPEPATTDYPTDAFLTFEDATAGLSIHGETRLDIEQFNLTIKNMLDVRYFLGKYPLVIRPCGRDVDAAIRLSYKSVIPRQHLTAQTPGVCSITFDNGTHSLVVNLQGQTYFANVNDQLDNSKIYLQELTLESHLDYTAGTDFTMTAGV